MGDKVAYVRHTVDAEDNKYNSRVYLVDTENGGQPRPYTASEGGASHPRWSPDGKWLAFLSGRPVFDEECGRQVWVLSSEGGEAYPLTCIEGGVRGFTWAPSGDMLAVSCRIDPDKGLTEAGNDEDDSDREEDNELQQLYDKYTEDVKHIDKIKYKADGAGFLQGKRSHVACVSFDERFIGSREQIPEPKLVTCGDFNHSNPVFSPDGRWLALSACRAENPDMQRFSDIWLFPVPRINSADEPVKVTDSSGPAGSPSWSPDGKTIAYLGHRRERSGMYTNTRLWLAHLDEVDGEPSAELVDLTEEYDVSFGDRSITDMRFSGGAPQLTWDQEGERIYYLTSERGTTHIVEVDVATGEPKLMTTGDRVLFNVHIRPELGMAAAAVARMDNPSVLHLLKLKGEPALNAGTHSDEVLDEQMQNVPEECLVETNKQLAEQNKVFTPERFTARADEDSPAVDGWIILPENDGEEEIPAVLQIHGGPTAMYTGTFFFEFQILAASGYAVVFTNPRGSSGYGEDFRAAIQPAWGDPDYADVMAGMKTALRDYPQIDEKRLGVAGGSYGGYMTNWIIGHTDLFSAAVSMRCVSNVHSFWGTSDIGYMWDEVFGGHPWEAPEKFRQQSPLSYMHEANTPTLIIHSEQDHRCPIEQGEQVYATLKKQGVEAEFLRYPGESHGLSRGGRPWHRIHRLDQITEWFKRYL